MLALLMHVEIPLINLRDCLFLDVHFFFTIKQGPTRCSEVCLTLMFHCLSLFLHPFVLICTMKCFVIVYV